MRNQRGGRKRNNFRFGLHLQISPAGAKAKGEIVVFFPTLSAVSAELSVGPGRHRICTTSPDKRRISRFLDWRGARDGHASDAEKGRPVGRLAGWRYRNADENLP